MNSIMVADYGYFLLALCFICHLYGTVASLVAAGMRHRRLLRSACWSCVMSTVYCFAAALLLWWALVHHDYSIGYVYKNSSDDLPWFFRISAFWSSLEGSHFLWTLLLGVYTSIALLTYAKENEHLIPYVSASLQAVLAWMFYLALTYSDPFVVQYPLPENGLGMNALLQNMYMMAHPPSLFTGYTALAIPFGYAMAALAYGDITEGWLRTIRHWTLYGWTFLTVGIFLGGRWAYVELGWAGYWAWDPVENSSFLPWLFATALLHSLVVQAKIGHLKRLSIIMAFLAFFFSFFGTFITRSGVISSVHSFAQSPIGPNYLYFLAVLGVVALLLYALRAPSILPADAQKVWGVSKESALVVTQFLLQTFALIVFIGTMYPIASEAITGVRFHVQAPYFNAFAPYIGLAFIVAVAIGNLMRYHKGIVPGGKRVIWLGQLLALPLTLLFSVQGKIFASQGFALWMQLLGVQLSFWAMFCLSYDLWLRFRQVRFQWMPLVRYNQAYLGAYLAHLGLLFAVLGFLGNFRGVDKTVTLNPGDQTSLYGYDFKFERVQVNQVQNATLYTAPLAITASQSGRPLGEVIPARAKYPTADQLFHEVGIHSHFWHDIYVVLSAFTPSESEAVTLQIFINPTVRIVWISVVFMMLGGLVAMFDPSRGRRSRDYAEA
ncbi:MAG: cytochrome c biogenesis protein CcsA [Zetaproteobacteria bacterium]|nr:cytochrome c biogenesis protein CcsA [Zetaproteobacteria bacterium]